MVELRIPWSLGKFYLLGDTEDSRSLLTDFMHVQLVAGAQVRRHVTKTTDKQLTCTGRKVTGYTVVDKLLIKQGNY